MLKKLFGFGKKKDKEIDENLKEDQQVETQEAQAEPVAEEIPELEEELEEAADSAGELQAEAEVEVAEELQSASAEEAAEPEAQMEPEEDPEDEREENPEQEEEQKEEWEEEREEAQEPQAAEPEAPAKGFFARLKEGLSKTTQSFTSKLDNLFKGYKTIDEDIYEELEEILITADVGFETTMRITEELRKRERENKIEEVEKLQEELEDIIEGILVVKDEYSEAQAGSEETAKVSAKKPRIMVVVGVNGVGKTTSIGKLASQLKNEGNSVMLAAADTFRAAASEQLTIWAQRADVPIVKHGEGADPSAVIFDAIKSAKANNADVLICDTAGRLHNKANLMNELAKIFKIISREYPEAEKEVLLVIDATTGQNAINQAKVFKEAAPLTGLILTKLDGTAKGGVVLGIISELSLPIKYIGVGEKIDDLQKFDARSFARALFGKNLQ
ncbi:MAG: signal recognition particle-docking protein FtsY [Proteocatella sp.]|nr:signal recognition particle-docking protein FtsY [Proteocatella sp.]MBP9658234.1 signal recognition particle-docking protein FtsY [Proteocatella sp.]